MKTVHKKKKKRDKGKKTSNDKTQASEYQFCY